MQEVLLVNPRHKRHYKRRHMSAKQAMYFGRNPRRRHRRRIFRFGRNPMPGGSTFNEIKGDLGPAIIGAAGGLVVDWIFGNFAASIPTTLTTGMMLPVTRLAAAVGVGAVAGMIAGKNTGQKVMLGALVVTSYSVIKNFLQTNVPSITLARFVPAGQRLRGIGYLNPGRPVNMPGMLANTPSMGPILNPNGSHLSRYVRR